MRLETERLALRPWRESDVESLVRYANNRNVSLFLRDHFPYPYTPDDAHSWIGRCLAGARPPQNFAIEHAGEAIGGIGLQPLTDVSRFTAEVGYWLGEPFWGHGFATEALRRITRYAFSTFDVERLEAHVFATNPASANVLRKAGYEHEAILKRSVFKDGQFIDCLLYARLRERT
ncbi:MAG TPA: GNAT family N-acetyltransferase [Thermoanaerobaculia bacterium]|nr:GNAT family N-acetyltransferase [Thermoanaerobaculia bacterium]